MGGWWWVVKSDSSVISLVKESRLLTFSELNEGELEWTRSSLDQELDNTFQIQTVKNIRSILFNSKHFQNNYLRTIHFKE